jgi:hypothetical protein
MFCHSMQCPLNCSNFLELVQSKQSNYIICLWATLQTCLFYLQNGQVSNTANVCGGRLGANTSCMIYFPEWVLETNGGLLMFNIYGLAYQD